LRFTVPVRSAQHPKPSPVLFVPFAEAGASGGAYRVWLRSPGASLPQQWSLLAEGKESRSRPGNRDGSINDGDPGSFVVTYDGKTAEEAWFAVALTAPATVRRVVFAHGQSFHDGGWFDCGAGKPRVQVRRAPSGPWETVGELGDYPAATAQDGAGLKPGDRFSVKLSAPVTVTAVRVIGKPASGDNPRQAFASCGEFEAFGD
jgi:hypothetical protein